MSVPVVTAACQAGVFAEQYVGSLMGYEMSGIVPRLGATKAGKAMTSGHSRLREESITETLLLLLASKYPSVVRAHTFTPDAESESSGADWIWTLRIGSKSIAMFVQAKRTVENTYRKVEPWTIDIPKDDKASRKSQHQTLLDVARKHGTRPMYSVYAPVRRNSHCINLIDTMIFMYPDAHMTLSTTAFMLLVHAANFHTGTHKFDFTFPGANPFANLLCCNGDTDPLDIEIIRRSIAFIQDGTKESEPWDEYRFDDMPYEDVIDRVRRGEGVGGVAEFDLGGSE